MDNAFDLTKISELIDSNHPSYLAIVDTNIVMYEPDPDNWQLSIEPTVFVISDKTVQELENIVKKDRDPHNKEREKSRVTAKIAISKLSTLFQKGSVTDGIPTRHGWIIGVSTANPKNLDTQLEGFEATTKTFGPSDTKLLILTRECCENITSIPVAFLTADKNLFNIVEINGLPCQLYRRYIGFPMEITRLPKPKPLNWKEVIDGIEQNIVENSIEVELTLQSRKLSPDWLEDDSHSNITAEGWGVVRNGTETISFLWNISFRDLSVYDLESPENNGVIIVSNHLNLLGNESIDENILKAIKAKISDLVVPNLIEETPTFQNPSVVMKDFLLSEYSREEKAQYDIELLEQAIKETDGDYLADGWIELILDCDEDDTINRLFRFVRAIRNCWQVGDKYTFRILRSEE